MQRALIIIDPQNDFITGSLPVPGAEQAMQQLAILLPKMKVDHLVVTMDVHPEQHMSFDTVGGPWPPHCRRYSQGAAIYPALYEAMVQHPAPTLFVEKGTDISVEEYSAFIGGCPSFLNDCDEVWLCGLAGNVCVLNSLTDLAGAGLAEKLRVIPELSPSLDDGSALLHAVEVYGAKLLSVADIEKTI